MKMFTELQLSMSGLDPDAAYEICQGGKATLLQVMTSPLPGTDTKIDMFMNLAGLEQEQRAFLKYLFNESLDLGTEFRRKNKEVCDDIEFQLDTINPVDVGNHFLKVFNLAVLGQVFVKFANEATKNNRIDYLTDWDILGTLNAGMRREKEKQLAQIIVILRENHIC